MRAPTNHASWYVMVGCAASIFAFSGGQSLAADTPQLSAEAKKHLKKLDEPIFLRGDYFKAVQVAYEDFRRVLAAKVEFGNSRDPDDAADIQWLANIENYDIYVEQTATSYVVQFDVTLRNNPPMIFGGRTRYTIDRSTFAITQMGSLK